MPTKADKGKAKPGDVAKLPLLEALFPAWADAAASEKEPTDKYEDPAGLVLPTETQPYLDAWKRPEDLVQNMSNLPVVVTKPGLVVDEKPAKGSKAAPPPVSREFEGKLFSGHRTFEWLQCIFNAVVSAQQALPPGCYLWELIHPRDTKDNSHIKPPSGKYKVKLFIMDTWRTVLIDDRIPVDLFGRPLLVGVLPLALWPLLLSKAVLKVMAAMRVLDLALPHQVSAFQLLTGWPHEDLMDPLAGVRLAGGFMFDRLEDSVRGNERRSERHAVATVCLKKRAMPTKPPPRIIVFTGPSAVGRGGLMRRLVADYPDKFGLTVSHTSRPPREHEVQGQDYVFSTKVQIRALAESGELLEMAPVVAAQAPGQVQALGPQAYLYGTSITTVREVAATGKLCVMAVDEQGVEALQANKRIDGLYVFCAPPSLDELEQRMRGRLIEAPATIEKRITWAAEQGKLAKKPGLFDHLVPNTIFDEVYHSLKEAISTLSPIIRNRLRGLPAYVLDYSDLIPPNMVEKPFLKPVIIAGPTTGERQRLIEQLVREFPDVFAFPRMTTTRPSDEVSRHLLSGIELALARKERQAEVAAARGQTVASRSSSPAPGDHWTEGEALDLEGGAEVADDAQANADESLYPAPASVSSSEFDAAVASGSLLEHHTDLFLHELRTHRVGVTSDAIREVIKSGRLPLIELEAEGAQAIKDKGIDCLSIFLNPASDEEFKQRLVLSLTETEEDVQARMAAAKAQMEAAAASNMFDVTLVNDQLDETYAELVKLISKQRPDILPPPDEDAPDALAPGEVARHGVLVLTGPASAGRAALAAQLQELYPSLMSVPGMVTDRKPAKGQVSTDTLTFVTSKELSKMAADNLLAVQWAAEGKDAGNVAITLAALEAVVRSRKVAMIELPEAATASALHVLKAGTLTSGALYVFVASAEANRLDAAPVPEPSVLASAAEAEGSGHFNLVITQGTGLEATATVRNALSAHRSDLVPPPHRPLVVCGPFGTGMRLLLQQLFQSLPGSFASPVVTTTKPSSHPDVDDRSGMVVVSAQEAAVLVSSGAFLFHRTALGHTYGVQASAVGKVQAAGKVCVIEVDNVENVKKLRLSGFDATYVYVGMSSLDELLERVRAEIGSNPPLGYEPEEAAELFFATAKSEIAASREEGLFDGWVDNTNDVPASFSRLAEVVHQHYPDVVVPQFVYGYGRGLWDPAVRRYGRHALQVMVLGPVASGKSTQCELLAERFALPHINVGDLLYDEIARKTELGLEAKEFTDASKTIPDRFFLELLTKRLAEPDCQANGWLLDGFPHTAAQAEELRTRGLEPDKVVFLHAENAVLLDRTRYRRVDMDTNRVYHMAEAGALSAAIQPLTPEGTLDSQILSRLHPRHDDSEENVAARLALWDDHMMALREVYEDVSLRVRAAGGMPGETFETLVSFLALESRVTDITVTPSHTLKELQYEVVDTVRHRRRQLFRLCQDDGKSFWVDSRELVGNAHCLLLARSPACLPSMQLLRRMDLAAVPRSALLWINSPEPAQVLVTLGLGPQSPLEDNPQVTPQLLVVCGPAGAGKSTLLHQLASEYSNRLVLVPAWTTRPARKGESEGKPFFFTDRRAMQGMLARNQMAGQVVAEHDGHLYAVRSSALQQAWAAGKLPVVEGPHALAAALKAAAAAAAPAVGASAAVSVAGSRPMTAQSNIGGVSMTKHAPSLLVSSLYLTADVECLDLRLRALGQLEEAALLHELHMGAEEAQRVTMATTDFEQRKQAALAGLAAKPPAAAPAAAAGGGATAKAAAETAVLAAQQAAAGAAAAAAAASMPPPEVPDYLVSNRERRPELVYQQVKEMLAGLWHRPRQAVPCQLLLEQFQWRSAAPGKTIQRLRTVMMSGGCLELPRGQHLMRISTSSDYPHALMFYSKAPCKQEDYICKANELSMVLTDVMETLQGEEGEAAASVVNLSGQFDPPVAGGAAGVLRYIFQVSEPTLLAGSLAVAREDQRRLIRMLLIDNASGAEICCCPHGQLQPTQLSPSPAGYTLLALAVAGPASRPESQTGPVSAEEDAGPVPWLLQLLTSVPLASVQESSITRAQALEGRYKPNARCVLARHMLTPIQPLQLALHAYTQPLLPFRVRVCSTPTGGEVVWGTSYPVVTEHTCPADGSDMLLPAVNLEPGKYLIEMTLDRDTCPEGWQPDPLSGDITGVAAAGSAAGSSNTTSKAVSWRMTLLPSVDDRVCPVTVDDSQQRYFRSLQEEWSAVATSATAAGKGAPPVKPATVKGGAPASGGARAAAAASLLDKLSAELAKQTGRVDPAPAAGGTTPEPVVTRSLKDGTVVELRPAVHMRTQSEQHTLPASVPTAQAVSPLEGVPETDGTESAAVRTQRADEFASWRSQAVTGQQQQLAARAEAMLAAKAALIAAREAADAPKPVTVK